MIEKVFPNEKVIVVGGALGGKIALQIGVNYGGDVKGIVPSGTSAGMYIILILFFSVCFFFAFG